MRKDLKEILTLRDKILKVLSGRLEGLFLAGGTALSLYYFHHRESFDLDFFTKEFSEKRIKDVISQISQSLKIDTDIVAELNLKQSAKMIRCYAIINSEQFLKTDRNEGSLKIDFVEDVYRNIESGNIVVEGIPVLSKENIYLRKIFAMCGYFRVVDDAGRESFLGGRQEAKDFFDLYHLSKTFIPFSKFVAKYCNPDEKEAIIIWHKRYDRLSMKSELLDIITEQKIDYRDMESHFNSEVENLIKEEIE
jgi:predicted nucleotidyltransferase component of viral defense system